jgi:hypothetical protein
MVVPIEESNEHPASVRLIRLVWIDTSGTKAWNMTTTLPHSEFHIEEDGDIWADGIVIDLDEIQ